MKRIFSTILTACFLSIFLITELQAQTFFAPNIASPFGFPTVNNPAFSNPSFGDIDNDGDYDLLMGAHDGKFYFYENIGTAYSAEFAAKQTNPFNLTDIGGRSAPTLADLDGDGDLDILSGSQNPGSFFYFENIGTESAPSFDVAVTSPYGLPTNPADFSQPILIDIDYDDDLDLFSGANDGKTYFYENTGTVTAPSFAASVQSAFGIADAGSYSSPGFVDWDNDNDFDLIISRGDGQSRCWENIGNSISPNYTYLGFNQHGVEVAGAYGTPTFIDIDNDGDQDLFFGESGGRIYIQEYAPSYSTISLEACDSLLSPSGNYTWYTSNTYYDTIPNAAGCDSLMTIDLVVNTATYATIDVAACETYTSPSGNYTWTENGLYNDTIPNSIGCDSIITIDLTFGTPSTSIIDEIICLTEAYSSPSGNYSWTDAGTYTDTIPNASTCDSIITINLSIDEGLDCGMIRHYPLNNDTEDYTVNEKHGTAYGAVSSDRYGIEDQCYQTVSDAGDNITVPTLGNWGDNLAISIWFKPDSLNASNSISNLIFSRGSGGAYQNFFANISHADSTVRFLVASNSGHGQVYSSNTVNIDEWNHMLIYHDGLNNKIGIVLNSVTTEIAWSNTPRYKNVSIGFGNYNNNVSPANGFDGKMDEIRFYDRQLTALDLDSLADPNVFVTSIKALKEDTNTGFFYPNPAQESIFFSKHAESVRIYNIEGRLIIENRNITELNISSLDSGMYLVESVILGQTSVSKLIVK